MDPVTALREEVKRLETALRLTQEYRQLAAVKAALKALGKSYAAEKPKSNGHGGHRLKGSGFMPLVIDIAVNEMRRTGQRMRSKAILALVVTEGVVVSFANPVVGIASALSQRPDLFNNQQDERGAGYGLVEWSQPKPDADQVEGEQPNQQTENGG